MSAKKLGKKKMSSGKDKDRLMRPKQEHPAREDRRQDGPGLT